MIGKETSAKPRVVGGDTFRCYVTGITKTEWRNNDGRIIIIRNHNSTTFSAIVDGSALRPRFHSLRTAMQAGVKALRAPPMPDGVLSDGSTIEIKTTAGMGMNDALERLLSPPHFDKGC